MASRLLPLLAAVALLAPAPASPQAASATPAAREEVVFLNEQTVLMPEYAVGNIAIGDPRVADYRVMPGRREIVIFGKGAGGTLLTLWDQRNVKRDEIAITVTTRQQRQLETDLRQLLTPFPAVEVRMFAGELSVTGAVSSQDDLAAVQRITQAAQVRNLVRYVAPTPGGALAAPGSATPGGAAAAAIGGVEYEVELLEASSRFRSGSYATGVEPSGRSLFKGVVKASVGEERDLFIGGNAVKPGSNGRAANQAVQTGLKLTVKPATPDNRGRFATTLLIETNLPFAGETYDPATWRRARWQITTASGEPFGITGAELLATPEAYGGSGGGLGNAARTASRVSDLPGVSNVAGTEYVPVFGSLFGSKSYKQKATQLLLVLRPKAVAP